MFGLDAIGQYALGEEFAGIIICGTAGCIVYDVGPASRPPLYQPPEDGFPAQIWEGTLPKPYGNNP